MKILIDDGMQIDIGTGIGKYTQYLYKYMKKNNDLFDVSLSNNKIFSKKNRKLNRIKYIFKINSKQYQEELNNYDYVWFTNYIIPFRKNKSCKYIVTIHDLVAFLYPETLPFLYRIYIRFMIKYSLKKANYIFTVSETAKNEIIKNFSYCKDKVFLLYPGLYDDIYNTKRLEEYDNENLKDIDNYPFFLLISTVEKRKNVGMVIDAFIKLKSENKESNKYKLVIAGRPGYGYQDFINKVRLSNYSEDIIFTGYISNKDCNHLYNKAKAFIFPTVYEGFGCAQIECMECNLPIILSDIQTNKEISKDYGEYFNLDDINTLISKMLIFVNGKYDYISKQKKAKEYLKEFNWEKNVKKIPMILTNKEKNNEN